jgi:hypothetical protein
MRLLKLFLDRYWSLLLALLVPFLAPYADHVPDVELFNTQEDASNAVLTLCFIYGAAAAMCLGLLVHSWVMQRRSTRNKWWLVFWTHALLFPALAATVMGLHRIQTFTYELSADFQRWGGGRWYQDMHFYAEDGAEKLAWIAALDCVLIILWAVVACLKKKSGKPAPRPA